jgi:hypothetical protein
MHIQGFQLPTAGRSAWTVVLPVVAAALVMPSAALADFDNDERGNNTDRVFFLVGSATPDRDPENPANEVIRFESRFVGVQGSPLNRFSGVRRIFDRKKVQARDLDNQLEVRHRFQEGDSCSQGAPRMQLAIDLDNDGDSEGNAFLYYGPQSTVGCPDNAWGYDDFTGGDMTIQGTGLGPFPSTGEASRGEENGNPNEDADVDPFQLLGPGEIPAFPMSGGFVATWSEFEVAIHTAFPNHRVCSALYVDDNGPNTGLGIGHADLISMGDATLNGHEDIARAPRFLPSDTCRIRVQHNSDDDDDDDGHHDDDDDNG